MMPDPNSTQVRPPSRAKPLTCPVCGLVAYRSFDIQARPHAPIRTDCLCQNSHIWSVHWSAA